MLNTVVKVKSQHSEITVADDYPYRYLFFDLDSKHGLYREQSAIQVNDLRSHVYDYSLLSMYSLRFISNPLNVLCVGCGAGVVPREMAFYTKANIDILEIDLDVIKIAKEHFYLDEKLNIILGDAFQTIEICN